MNWDLILYAELAWLALFPLLVSQWQWERRLRRLRPDPTRVAHLERELGFTDNTWEYHKAIPLRPSAVPATIRARRRKQFSDEAVNDLLRRYNRAK